jgi:hypothetical protein
LNCLDLATNISLSASENPKNTVIKRGTTSKVTPKCSTLDIVYFLGPSSKWRTQGMIAQSTGTPWTQEARPPLVLKLFLKFTQKPKEKWPGSEELNSPVPSQVLDVKSKNELPKEPSRSFTPRPKRAWAKRAHPCRHGVLGRRHVTLTGPTGHGSIRAQTQSAPSRCGAPCRRALWIGPDGTVWYRRHGQACTVPHGIVSYREAP